MHGFVLRKYKKNPCVILNRTLFHYFHYSTVIRKNDNFLKKCLMSGFERQTSGIELTALTTESQPLAYIR